MRKPKGIIFLIVWFLWATGQDLDTLIRYPTTTDYYVFAHAGMETVFFFMAGLLFLLDAAVVYCLFQPRKTGRLVIFGAIGVSVVYDTVAILLALRDLPGVRETYETGRQLRGLPVRQEAMEMIFTPQAMLISLAVSIAVYAVVGFIAQRNRDYMAGQAAAEMEA